MQTRCSLCLLILVAWITNATEGNLSARGGKFGTLTSAHFPAPYANNLNDTWIITAARGYRVVLYFTTFDLEDSFANGQPCALDYLEILDGSPSSNKSFGRYCGNPTTFWEDAPSLYTQKFTSSGQVMTVRMISDYSNDLPNTSPPTGFRAHYYQEDRNECAELRAAYEQSEEPETVGMCDHYCNNYLGGYYCTCKPGYQLHSDGYSCSGKCSKVRMQQHEGTIRSPGFPHNYPRLTDCSWTVETDAGKRLHFQVNTNFHIEQHQSGFCAYDWIKITDSSGELGTFCGDGVPFNGSELITTTNWFEVQLHTDYLVQKPGFSITYRTQEIRCKIPPPPMHGSILSPSITTAGPNFVPFGGLIRYDCGVGYRVIGSAKLLCLKDGSLSDDPPVFL